MIAVLMAMRIVSVCVQPGACVRRSVSLSQRNVDVEGMQKGGGASVLLVVIHVLIKGNLVFVSGNTIVKNSSEVVK